MGLLLWRGIQKSEIIIYEEGSKVNRNNDKITGYHWRKRITIDVMIFLLKDVIPVFGVVITMSVVIGPTLWFTTNIGIVGYGCIADFDCCQTFDCKKDKRNSRKIIWKTGVVFDSQSFVLYRRCENSIFPCHQML